MRKIRQGRAGRSASIDVINLCDTHADSCAGAPKVVGGMLNFNGSRNGMLP